MIVLCCLTIHHGNFVLFAGDNFFSYVMYRVRGCRVQRDKELKKRKMEAVKQAKHDREQEIIEWEKNLMKEPNMTQMKAMWEVCIHIFQFG